MELNYRPAASAPRDVRAPLWPLLAGALVCACAGDLATGATGGGMDTSVSAVDVVEAVERAPVSPPTSAFALVWPAGVSALATADGGLYVAGELRGELALGGEELQSSGIEEDLFLAALSADGDVRWAARYGSERDDQVAAIAADASGVVLVGSVKSPIDFGGGVVGAGTKESAFVVSFDADGGHRWSRVWGNNAWVEATCVALDAQGNVIAGGILRDTLDFGGGPLTSDGGGDVFVASFDAAGEPRWSRAFGGDADDRAVTVSADASGNVYLTGLFQGQTNYPDADLSESRPGWSELFILGLWPDGAHRWVKTFGDVGPIDLVSASLGPIDLVFAGSVLGSVDLGGGLLDSDSGTDDQIHHTRDVVTARFGLDGAHRLSTSFPSGGQEWGKHVGTDAAGNSYVAGWYSEAFRLGDVEHTNSGALDTFLLSRTPAGAVRWSLAISGEGEDRASAMTVSPAGVIYLAGRFEGTLDVAGATVQAGEGVWSFLVRLD